MRKGNDKDFFVLELSWDAWKKEENVLNQESGESRPRRKTAAEAEGTISVTAGEEDDEEDLYSYFPFGTK